MSVGKICAKGKVCMSSEMLVTTAFETKYFSSDIIKASKIDLSVNKFLVSDKAGEPLMQ